MLERLAALDVAAFTAVHRALWGSPWRSILQFAQLAGETSGLVAMLVFAVLFAPRGRRRELLARLIVPVGFSYLVCSILKYIVAAPRPRMLIPDVLLNADPALPRSLSWPSGHTTIVFAFATAVLLLRLFGELPPRRWTGAAVFAFGVACVTGVARVVVGAHFPGDVLAGAIVGVGSAHLAARAMDEILRRYSARSRAPQSLH